MAELSKHILFEETKQGLNLEIVDQDGPLDVRGWLKGAL